MQVQSTYEEPGYRLATGAARVLYSQLGHQTHVALVAPTWAKMSCTWRHSATYAAVVFSGVCPAACRPVPKSHHGPFISQSKRRKKGCPHAFAASAQALI